MRPLVANCARRPRPLDFLNGALDSAGCYPQRAILNMASVVPGSGKIKTFFTEAAFESWMRIDANFPADLRKAIDASPRARKTFQSLGRQNLYALAFRTTNMKTPAGRARKIAALVDMLERGETPHPERR